jgi:molecular chaperone GrpE (heat shock protein)
METEFHTKYRQEVERQLSDWEANGKQEKVAIAEDLLKAMENFERARESGGFGATIPVTGFKHNR